MEGIERYHPLLQRLGLDQGVPYSENWSAAPDFIELIVEHVGQVRPTTILECSSGLTTLALAQACRLTGCGTLVSLENGSEYAANTRSYLTRYGLTGVASIHDAPLTGYTLDGDNYQWYALPELPADPIELVVVDGPPGFIQQNARYPVLPLLYERLADGCVIIMDDAAREDEREIVELWRRRYHGLECRYIETERGCSVVTISRS